MVSGIGKSGHIGQKIAATLAGAGTRAVFLHTAEAVHGDLGIYTPGDPSNLISKRGSTAVALALGGRPGGGLGAGPKLRRSGFCPVSFCRSIGTQPVVQMPDILIRRESIAKLGRKSVRGKEPINQMSFVRTGRL